MRIYRSKYKDKHGWPKTLKKWWIELRDDSGQLRRFSTFEDKQLANLLLRNIQELRKLREGKLELSEKLQVWFTDLPIKLQTKLVELNLLDTKWATSNTTLLAHVADWEKHLRAKGDVKVYTKMISARVRRIINECGFRYWRDIYPSKIEQCVATFNLSKRTQNFYLKSIRMFCSWVVEDGRAVTNPVQHLKTLRFSAADIKHKRRVLSKSDIRHLLEITKEAPLRFGMTGFERYLLYKLAIEIGLRRNELRSLTVSSFDFRKRKVTLEAAASKNKKKAVLPLNKDTAAELQNFLRNKTPYTKAFGGTYKQLTDHTSDMIQLDLQDANIPYIDEEGGVFDFHSLRHQCGTLLAAAGIHPKVAQSIMRHSDINLTMTLYTHTLVGQDSQALEDAFKFWGKPSEEEKKA